jgi:hypothetical protein
MMTELATPNSWTEAWQQAKKVENALRKGTIGNPLLQPANVNQALVSQMTKMEETIQVLTAEVKENKEACTRCNRKGHIAKDCYAKITPNNNNSDFVPKSPCPNCGRKGHWARDCTAPKQCKNCNGKGLLAKDCYSNNNKGSKCYKCDNFGHIARDCKKEIKCYSCQNFGHTSKECNKNRNNQNNRNTNNNQNYNNRPKKQIAYISQEEETLNTLASTVGDLVKKIENLKV